MLIGEYRHTLDKKKRVAVPAKFRRELGKKIVLTHGFDSCLFVYPLKEWKSLSDKLSTLSIGQRDTRSVNRFMFAGAVETEIDSLGRILIPDFLKDFAKLNAKLVIIGVHGRVEIWDEKLWARYKGKVEKEADVLAEKLGDLGVF